jgi:hypothetical protein
MREMRITPTASDTDPGRRWVAARFTLDIARQVGIELEKETTRDVVNMFFPPGLPPEIERQFQDELRRYWQEIRALLARGR